MIYVTDELESIEGMNEETAEKLRMAGITTRDALVATPVPKLVELDIPRSTAVKIMGEAWKKSMFGFQRGDALIHQFQERQYVTSGTRGLDRILGGTGFETQNVYEIYGPEGAGKSTLLHQLVCTACLSQEKGGLGAGTIYIDTERSFSIRKVEQIARRFGIDPVEIRRKIIRIAPPISDVLVYFCENLLGRVAEENGARLFLLDSLATQFRAEYGTDSTTMPERQKKADRVIKALMLRAQLANGVAIYTNQVTVDSTGYGKPKPHAMGLLVGHAAMIRLKVQRKPTRPNERVFRIEKGVDLSEESCLLDITPEGFVDTAKKRDELGKKGEKISKT